MEFFTIFAIVMIMCPIILRECGPMRCEEI
jgi:hypothetical protein